MRSFALLLTTGLCLAACQSAPGDKPANENTAYRAEPVTGSNIARRDARGPVTEEERARAREDAEAMMRGEEMRRASMSPSPSGAQRAGGSR